ncbi:MAG: TIGR02206 family membrane protein [Planctomycetota bacterium]
MRIALAQGFESFSLLHAVAAMACVAVIVGLVMWGRRTRRRNRERQFTAAIAWLGLAFWVFMQVYFLLLEQDWTDSLPLHVCDLAGLVGPVALLTRWRTMRATLYFWALGLSIWGLVTPTLSYGPEHIRFWLFWISHGLVIFYAVYDCAVNRYRPYARDYGTACLVTLAYLGVILPLNLANEGWNYAYVGNVDAGAATPLDLLPPWPWRILGLQALGAFIMALVWLPWEVSRFLARGPKPSDSTPS